MPDTVLTPASLLQLIWLASPALPVGEFSYSEVLEAAVERAGVATESIAFDWLSDPLQLSLARSDLPVIVQAVAAWREAIFLESGSSTTGYCRPVKQASCGHKPSKWGAHWWSGCATMMGLTPRRSRPVPCCRRPTRWRLRWLRRLPVQACATACWPMLSAGPKTWCRRL